MTVVAPIEVHTNLNPQQLTEVAIETFRQWLLFALGRESIGGKTLAHPSGRYAASLSWRRIGQSRIAIIADEDIAPEAASIETGTSGADIRAAMLPGGKISADGHRYRRIPMREDMIAPSTASFVAASVNQAARTGAVMPTNASFWIKRKENQGSDRVVTMTETNGKNNWRVPPQPAYAPAAILASLIRKANPQ